MKNMLSVFCAESLSDWMLCVCVCVFVAPEHETSRRSALMSRSWLFGSGSSRSCWSEHIRLLYMFTQDDVQGDRCVLFSIMVLLTIVCRVGWVWLNVGIGSWYWCNSVTRYWTDVTDPYPESKVKTSAHQVHFYFVQSCGMLKSKYDFMLCQ